MTAKVICLASPKGGSGKTIITANFSSFLSFLDKKCLVVDCDLATHGMTLLYLHEITKKKSGHDENPKGILETQVLDPERDLIKLSSGVDFLPATYSFGTPIGVSKSDFFKSLSNALYELRDEYDYIFLDAQAGTDEISQVAMSKPISDEVVIVSEYDPLSAAGVERLKLVMGDSLEFTRTWVLLNKMLPEFVEKFSDFLSVARYVSPIPWNADVVRSYSRKKLAIDVEYGNEYTLALMQTLKSLLGEEVAKEIDRWAEGRAETIRQPIEAQYSDAECELLALLDAKAEMSRTTVRSAIKNFAFLMVFVIGFSFVSTDLFVDQVNLIFGFSILESLEGSRNVLVPMISMILLVFLILKKEYYLPTSKEKLEQSRIDRQIRLLEERLKQLEALKKADYKTLLRSKQV